MRRLAVSIALLCCALRAQTTTTVADTILAPNGSASGVRGTIIAELTGFCTQGAHTIRPVPIRINVNNGVLSQALIPSDSCSEGDTLYSIRYEVRGPGGPIKANIPLYWNVPTSGSPVQIDAIETENAGTPPNGITDADIPDLDTLTTGITASRAVVTDGSALLAASATTATEIGYVSGVTSAIQTQLDAKLAKAFAANAGAIPRVSGAGTLAEGSATDNGSGSFQLMNAVTNSLKIRAGTYTGTEVDPATHAQPIEVYQSDGTTILSYFDRGGNVKVVNGSFQARDILDVRKVQVTGNSDPSVIGISLANDAPVRWSSDSGSNGTPDIAVYRGAAGVLHQRLTTTAQGYCLYATFTDASNYERACLTTADDGGLTIATGTAGTGADNLNLTLTPSGTGIVVVNGTIDADNITLNAGDVGALLPTADQKAALDGAASPTALNPFATMADVGNYWVLDSYNDVDEIATPGSNPASGKARAYFKTGGSWCWLSTAGVEQCLGGTGTTILSMFDSDGSNFRKLTVPDTLSADVTFRYPNAAPAGTVFVWPTPSGGISEAAQYTLRGNATQLQLTSGSVSTDDCAKFDANGNLVSAGAACGASGTVLYERASIRTNGSSALTAHGDAAATSGTASSVAPTTSTTHFVQYASVATTDSDSRVNGNGTVGWHENVVWEAHLKFEETTTMRVWAGLVDAGATLNTVAGSDTSGTHTCAFRYSTSAGDTNWMAVANDAGVTPTTGNTGVAFGTTAVTLRIEVTDGVSCVFKINGSTVATLTADLPASTAGVRQWVNLRTLDNVARNLKVSRMRILQ